MKKLFFTGLLVLTTLGLTFTGCKKDQVDEETESATDNALSEGTFTDVKNMADEANNDGGLSNYRVAGTMAILSGCATITHDTSSTPRKVTIDFGTGCKGKDLKLRSGKIIVSYTGKFRDVGTVVSVTFDNYYVEGNKVEGTKTWTNRGKINGYTTFDVVVDGKITKAVAAGASPVVITWKANRSWQWTKGESTATRLDDEYTILVGATSEGSNTNGGHYISKVTKDLVRNVACHEFVSGTLEFTPDSKPTRTIDFGNGDCDGQATIYVNGRTKVIYLK